MQEFALPPRASSASGCSPFTTRGEREADYLGVRAMKKAGYNRDSIVTMFQRILKRREGQELARRVFANIPTWKNASKHALRNQLDAQRQNKNLKTRSTKERR